MKREEITTDLTGQTFGKLTVLRRVPGKKHWICRCACGRELEVREWYLLNNQKKTCGFDCAQRESATDLTGQTFGRLTVLRRVPGKKRWICRCECGREIEVAECHLTGKRRRSCGFCDQKKEGIVRDVFSVCEIPKQEICQLAKKEGLTFGEYAAKQYIFLTKGRPVNGGIVRKENA